MVSEIILAGASFLLGVSSSALVVFKKTRHRDGIVMCIIAIGTGAVMIAVSVLFW